MNSLSSKYPDYHFPSPSDFILGIYATIFCFVLRNVVDYFMIPFFMTHVNPKYTGAVRELKARRSSMYIYRMIYRSIVTYITWKVLN